MGFGESAATMTSLKLVSSETRASRPNSPSNDPRREMSSHCTLYQAVKRKVAQNAAETCHSAVRWVTTRALGRMGSTHLMLSWMFGAPYLFLKVRVLLLVLLRSLSLCCDLILTSDKECHLPKRQLRQTPSIRPTMASSAAQRSVHTRLCSYSASEA